MEIRDKHLLVTGSGKRVAASICEYLAEMGPKITLHYRNSEKEAKSLQSSLQKKGVKCQLLQGDLVTIKDFGAWLNPCEKAFGPVDVLINSASDFYPTPAETVTENQWDALNEINVKVPFFLSQAVRKKMKSGVIINIADVNGERALPKFTPYVVSKAGLLMLTKNLAKEWAPSVRVNSISPGAVLLPESYSEEQKKHSIERSLLGRLGSPKDIAEGILFLIRNEYITGFNLKVDGGRSLT